MLSNNNRYLWYKTTSKSGQKPFLFKIKELFASGGAVWNYWVIRNCAFRPGKDI